eukprot:jgi/Botrbrau1/12316/Bobra.0205s0014.1
MCALLGYGSIENIRYLETRQILDVFEHKTVVRTVAGVTSSIDDLSALYRESRLPITFHRLWAHALPAEPSKSRSEGRLRMGQT